MHQKPRGEAADEMLDEYDFTAAVRGKYYGRYREGTNVILLDPDVAEVFRDATAVNEALRLLVSIARARVAGPPAGALKQRRANKPGQPSSHAKSSGQRRRAARR